MDTNNFTGLVQPSTLMRQPPIDEICNAVIQESLTAPTTPTVRASQTVTISLESGGCGETYVWSQTEASLIRDALIEILGY